MSNDEIKNKVGDTQEEPSGNSSNQKRQPQGEGRSLLLYIVAAVAVAFLVRFFIAAPYLVKGPSMEETFHNNDYLIVDHFSYGPCAPWPIESACLPVGDPQRGDVVVFTIPVPPGETLIKRIIGLPGETVEVKADNSVVIKNSEHPDGFTINEPYISPKDAGGPTGTTVTLGKDEYFAMGDNRNVSYDSRSWGVLPRKDIIGRVLLRLYPFTDIGALPGEARYGQ